MPVFGKRSCSGNKPDRDDDSKRSHPDLAAARRSFPRPVEQQRRWIAADAVFGADRTEACFEPGVARLQLRDVIAMTSWSISRSVLHCNNSPSRPRRQCQTWSACSGCNPRRHMRILTLPALFAALIAAASPLAAQPWPTRTVRIVTGTPAGGSPDFVSRLLADKLSERIGQAVVVENSTTTGVAAWNAVAKSQPDGYTVSMLTGAFSARAAVAKSLPYDPIKDFAFITLISGYPMVVATAPNSPLQSFGDLRPHQGRAVRRNLRDEPARQRAPSDRRIDQRRSRHF